MATHHNALCSPRLARLRILGFLVSVASGLLLAACSTMGQGPATPPRQFDTGSMALPAPLPQGEVGTSRVR